MAAVFQLAAPIGFDAPDEQPVGLLIFLLVPEAATQETPGNPLGNCRAAQRRAPARTHQASTDAELLHKMIADWKSTQPA